MTDTPDAPQPTPTRRTALLSLGASTIGISTIGISTLGISTLATPAIAKYLPTFRWRMATSWPKALPGPGISADRLAQRITTISGGRLTVEVFAANTIVPALNVLEAVSNNIIEMGHSAALFWRGKLPASAIFTTVPFGLSPIDHAAWLRFGGGQALWDELYAPLNVKAFLGGNTGASMGGWFRKPIQDVQDIKGLRIRAAGLSGEIFNRLGATSLVISPSDTYASLERGTIDAVEFLAPMNDISTGVQKVAPYYAMPGFNKPNGAAEALISRKAWESLPADLQALVEEACMQEHATGLMDAHYGNAQALTTLVQKEGVKLFQFPHTLLDAALKITSEVMAEIGATSPLANKIVASYQKAQETTRPWSQLETSMSAHLHRMHP